MTPSEAIKTVKEPADELMRKVSALRCEAEDVAERWLALGMAGGQRDDHAADLMGMLELHLRDIAIYAERVRAQILKMKADPFGRKEREQCNPCIAG